MPIKRARSECCCCPQLPSPKRRLLSCSSPSPDHEPARGPRPSLSKSPPLPLPLTRENLDRFLQSQSSGSASASASAPSPLPSPLPSPSDSAIMAASSRTSSPSRSNLDDRNKLAAYRILVDKGYDLPPGLREHVAILLTKPRDTVASPNARKVVSKRRVAAQQNERGGIKQLEPFLLFRGEAEMDDRVTGVPQIYSKDEVNLARSFLPPAPNENVKKTWGQISQPRPDTAIGYITRADADNTSPPCQKAFSADEEDILDGFRLTRYLHFPFLTSQWKTPDSDQNASHAQNQAARDGAVVVNHLRDFYNTSYGPEREPQLDETCHFSVTCDLHYTQIWVHWKEQAVHHMELVFECSLRQEEQVQEARRILWNIVQYATHDRLQSIKAAIPAFAKNRVSTRQSPVKSTAESVVSDQSLQPNQRFEPPMTPNSPVSEPSKKRKKPDAG